MTASCTTPPGCLTPSRRLEPSPATPAGPRWRRLRWGLAFGLGLAAGLLGARAALGGLALFAYR